MVLTEPSPPGKTRPVKQSGRTVGRRTASGLIGLGILMAIGLASAMAREAFHLSLPAPVIGLALLASVLLLAERFHASVHSQLSLHLSPVGRALISHMSLLFVPAGVGIIAEGATLRREWVPIIAGLFGSTLLGVLAAGWFMQRFAPRNQPPSS